MARAGAASRFPEGAWIRMKTSRPPPRARSSRETGYAGEVVHLTSTWISAYSTARKHIFIMPAARRISQPAPEPSELSRVVQVSLDDFRTVLADGALTDLDAGLLCLQRLT